MYEAGENELLDAVKESLQNDGKLGKFKAELRSAVMSILNKNNSNEEAPKIPTETKFMNDLIREYLSWNGYLYAEQMLSAESGMEGERPNREYLASKLGVVDTEKTAKIPLLYYVVLSFTQPNEEGEREKE